MYREMQTQGEYAIHGSDSWAPDSIDGPIKPSFWNPKRICLTDNSGDHLILDLDTPDEGLRGQIIDHSHEVGPQTMVATSWADLLHQLADDLEAGVYVYVEEEEMVTLPGMYD
jgi:cell wall assembly regulator SMI1